MRKNILLAWGLLIALCAHAADYGKFYENLPCTVKQVEPVVIPDNQVSIADCGAVGDGITLCTEAFVKAISKVTQEPHRPTPGAQRHRVFCA